MKKFNSMRSFAAILFAATALCACNDSNSDNKPVKGGGLTDLKAETIVIDSKKTAVGSAVAAPFSEGVYIAATAAEGLESAEDIFATGEYVYVWVSPALVGREFDLTTEKSSFTVMSVWGEDIFIQAANEMTSEDSGITEGKCLVKNDGDKYEAFVTMKTVEGVEISMRAAAVMAEEANTNTITYDDASKPLRASFYMVDEGAHFLYFTPSEVYYFEEMQEMAIYYAYIMLMNPELATGRTIDLEGNNEVMVGLMDARNVDEEPSYLSAVEGSLKIKIIGEGEYEVYLDAKLDNDKTVTVEFTGVCTPVDAEKEISNSFTFNGNENAINTVYIEKTSAEMWTLYFSGMSEATFDEAKQYSPVKTTLPPFGEDQKTFGFSAYDFMSIEYGPNVWNNANGSIGTVNASLEGNILNIDFTTYDGGLSGEYAGEANIVE